MMANFESFYKSTLHYLEIEESKLAKAYSNADILIEMWTNGNEDVLSPLIKTLTEIDRLEGVVRSMKIDLQRYKERI